MLFSVVVPIYKVEEYLPQCIESVLNQTFNNYELILVDDGSPDNSGAICDKYAEKDTRIRVVHKKNGGLSDARNAGISIANGEFIWCLDSDDFMAESAMSDVAEFIIKNNDLDMLTCAYINHYSNGEQEIASLPHETTKFNMNREEYLSRINNVNGNYWSAWRNIYRRSVVNKNNISFPKGIIGAEDCDFFMNFIRSSNKFAFLNIPVVHYRTDREESITNVMSIDSIIGRLTVYKNNYLLFKESMDAHLEFMTVFFANKFANGIYHLHHLNNKSDIVLVETYIKENKAILKHTKATKYTIAKFVWSLFGYYNGSKLLRLINPKS